MLKLQSGQVIPRAPALPLRLLWRPVRYATVAGFLYRMLAAIIAAYTDRNRQASIISLFS